MTEENRQWYVARTRDKQELSIGKKMKALGVDYFLPTRREIRQLKDRRKEVEVPIIRNLIFVHATKQQAIDLHNKEGLSIFYLIDRCTRTMMVVPKKQMSDFIQVMTIAPDCVSFDGEELIPGDRVRVVKGDFCGIEGEVANDVNGTYLILRVQDLFAATIKIAKSYLRKIK